MQATAYNSDNWEPEFTTIFVTWQLRVTLDSIRNSCNVLLLIEFQSQDAWVPIIMLDDLLPGNGWPGRRHGHHCLLCLQVSRDSPQWKRFIYTEDDEHRFFIRFLIQLSVRQHPRWSVGAWEWDSCCHRSPLAPPLPEPQVVWCSFSSQAFYWVPPLFRLPTWHTVHSLAANRNLGLLTLAFRFSLDL